MILDTTLHALTPDVAVAMLGWMAFFFLSTYHPSRWPSSLVISSSSPHDEAYLVFKPTAPREQLFFN